MIKVYIVTDGIYSEYRIVKVLSTREKAEEYCSRFENGQTNIEEFILDDEYEKNKGKKYFIVEMLKDGTTIGIKPTFPNNENSIEESDFFIINSWSKEGITSLIVRCWANDERHAVKIANEKRIITIANNEWHNYE